MLRKLLRNEAVGGLAVGVFSALALALATPKSAQAFDACEFDVGPDHSNCCACNAQSCIEVQHQGVASCTFEFCSSTPCAAS